MTPCALHCEAAGPVDGPPLLLGGSLGSTLAMWDPQVAELSARLRVIRFDQRGHGGSPVPPGPYSIADLGRDVLALIDRLGLERVSFCGLSIGGMVGMWLGAHAPERIDRLILLCTSAFMPPAAGWLERAATVRAAGSVATIADAVVARWVTPAWAERHPDRFAELRAMVASSPAEGYAGCCEAIAGMDLRPALERIAAPTLVVAGGEDPATPPAHGEAIVAAIPDARLAVVPAMAHLGNVEQPAEVSRLILDHLGQAERVAPAGPDVGERA